MRVFQMIIKYQEKTELQCTATKPWLYRRNCRQTRGNVRVIWQLFLFILQCAKKAMPNPGPFLFNIFFSNRYFCVALCAKFNLCKLQTADVESVFSVYARDKEFIFTLCVAFAVCNGRIVFALGSYRCYVRKQSWIYRLCSPKQL